jgi:hypothetical protein
VGSHNSDKLLSGTLFSPKNPVLASFSAKNGKKGCIWGILSQYVKVFNLPLTKAFPLKKQGFIGDFKAAFQCFMPPNGASLFQN